MPYASATEGTRVRRRGFLNAVARRRVWSSVILWDVKFVDAKLHELGGFVEEVKLHIYSQSEDLHELLCTSMHWMPS